MATSLKYLNPATTYIYCQMFTNSSNPSGKLVRFYKMLLGKKIRYLGNQRSRAIETEGLNDLMESESGVGAGNL